MAELSIFTYRPRPVWIVDCDPRIKLAALAGLSICSLGAGWTALALVTVVTSILWLRLVPSLRVLWNQTKYFIFLLALVVLARGLLTPGQVLLELGPLDLTAEGLAGGGYIAWRLLVIVWWSIILTATTAAAQIRSAVAWFLRPVPLVNEKVVATMIGLLVRFIPVILQQVRETMAAQQARAVAASSNPFRRAFKLILPVVRRVFLSADRLVWAMEARCFTPDRPFYHLDRGPADWLLASGAVVLCAALLLS